MEPEHKYKEVEPQLPAIDFGQFDLRKREQKEWEENLQKKIDDSVRRESKFQAIQATQEKMRRQLALAQELISEQRGGDGKGLSGMELLMVKVREDMEQKAALEEAKRQAKLAR